MSPSSVLEYNSQLVVLFWIFFLIFELFRQELDAGPLSRPAVLPCRLQSTDTSCRFWSACLSQAFAHGR